MKFTVPPECAGQIVEYAYASDETCIYERVTDRSDNSVVVRRYEHPDAEMAWDPWNGIPALGTEIVVGESS